VDRQYLSGCSEHEPQPPDYKEHAYDVTHDMSGHEACDYNGSKKQLKCNVDDGKRSTAPHAQRDATTGAIKGLRDLQDGEFPFAVRTV